MLLSKTKKELQALKRRIELLENLVESLIFDSYVNPKEKFKKQGE